MRLKEIKSKVVKASELVKLSVSIVQGQQSYVLEGWLNFKEAILLLNQTPLLENQIKPILNWERFNQKKDRFIISSDDYKLIGGHISRIQTSLPLILESFNFIEVKDDPTLIAVKIPEPANLQELNKYVDSLDKIFTPLLTHPKIGGQVKFHSFDQGSSWVEFLAGNQVAVALAAAISWSATVIYKKLCEARLINKYVKGLDIKNESLKDLEQGVSKMVELLINIETEAIKKDFFDEKDNEQIKRIHLSIKLLSQLIEKGAEVHPALNQPEKVTNLFPDFRNLEGLESRVKKINSKKADE